MLEQYVDDIRCTGNDITLCKIQLTVKKKMEREIEKRKTH